VVLSWNILTSTVERSFRIFDLRTDRAVSPRTGVAHDFFILESPPWVNVIPLTSDDQVVLIRQYRHGTRQTTLEIPGGLVEDFDDPRSAALRELREETGFEGRHPFFVGKVHPNPAILNNECHTFAVLDVVRTGEQKPDDKEDIEVLTRPLAQIPELIATGQITHSLVLCAFLQFFMLHRPDILHSGSTHELFDQRHPPA